MNRLIAILFSIILIAGCTMVAPIPPYTGPDHDTIVTPIYPKISKIVAQASPTLVLRRYIVRGTLGNTIGVYKIEVGNQQRIKDVLYKMTVAGFNGTTYQPRLGPEGRTIKDEWITAKIITEEDRYGIATGIENRQVVNLKDITPKDLPRGLGKLKSLHLIEKINIYDDYPESLSIFVNSGTTIPEAYLLMYAIKEILDENE